MLPIDAYTARSVYYCQIRKEEANVRLFTSVKEAMLLLDALKTFQRSTATTKEAEIIDVMIERIEKCLQLQNKPQ